MSVTTSKPANTPTPPFQHPQAHLSSVPLISGELL